MKHLALAVIIALGMALPGTASAQNIATATVDGIGALYVTQAYDMITLCTAKPNTSGGNASGKCAVIARLAQLPAFQPPFSISIVSDPKTSSAAALILESSKWNIVRCNLSVDARTGSPNGTCAAAGQLK